MFSSFQSCFFSNFVYNVCWNDPSTYTTFSFKNFISFSGPSRWSQSIQPTRIIMICPLNPFFFIFLCSVLQILCSSYNEIFSFLGVFSEINAFFSLGYFTNATTSNLVILLPYAKICLDMSSSFRSWPRCYLFQEALLTFPKTCWETSGFHRLHYKGICEYLSLQLNR